MNGESYFFNFFIPILRIDEISINNIQILSEKGNGHSAYFDFTKLKTQFNIDFLTNFQYNFQNWLCQQSWITSEYFPKPGYLG